MNVLYKEVQILKSALERRDNFRYGCSICFDENKGKRYKTFNDIDVFERHVRASHSNHPSYRAVKLLIKNLRIAIDLGLVINK